MHQANIDLLRPHLGSVVPFLASNLLPHRVSLCNNASWAIGEIFVRVSHSPSFPSQVSHFSNISSPLQLTLEEISPFIEMILSKLVAIILDPQNDIVLLENCAITIGRLGMVAPKVLSDSMPAYLPQWCRLLQKIHDPVERV